LRGKNDLDSEDEDYRDKEENKKIKENVKLARK